MAQVFVENSKALKDILVVWAKKHDVTPSIFSQAMGYTYAHAWSPLRGRREFTPEAFGRFALAYGIKHAQELLELAEIHINDEPSIQNNILSDERGDR